MALLTNTNDKNAENPSRMAQLVQHLINCLIWYLGDHTSLLSKLDSANWQFTVPRGDPTNGIAQAALSWHDLVSLFLGTRDFNWLCYIYTIWGRSHCKSMATSWLYIPTNSFSSLAGGSGCSRSSRRRSILSWGWRPASSLVLLFDTQRLLVNVPDLFRGGCIEREYFLSQWRSNGLGIILLIISSDDFHPMKTGSHVMSNLRKTLLFIYAPRLCRSTR